MKAYLDLLTDIVNFGSQKHPTRVESGLTKNGTIGLPHLIFKHDMRNGFPLVTTRKINWYALVGELRCFLKGKINNDAFMAEGCNFWTPWAREDGDLGPIYGKQWVNHGQLDHVLTALRRTPYDRRMVVSAWRPDEHDQMVLPPCHVMWNVVVYGSKLHLSWIQRSCDMPIGVPYNIASYALLQLLLCEWANLQPGTLTGLLCDAHIYANQLDGVSKQIGRRPLALPDVDVHFKDRDDFRSWDCDLINYNHHPHISFGEVEV
jgi:thymidylate synthase